ncbi:hypothetical protein H2200_006547 [Cladophialophora chaetospira]|uniref:Uncharacterized protein n=1 Tax=Cladophialophora chaetospira TaxID=386627 RepID=A0AA38X8E6_9EURO|nr:hypothetical protein H2200_006547 [Cladophialophora chaetospira]
MDRRQSAGYEPYRHRDFQEPDDAEKPLVPETDNHMPVHQQQPRNLSSRAARNPIRVGLRILALIITVTILAMQAHSTYVWLQTRRNTQLNSTTHLHTRVWAVLDIWPTWTMLGVSLLAVMVHLVSFLALCACCRSVRESIWHTWLTFLSSFLLVAAWSAALVYFKIVDSQGNKKKHWDLWSWTCHCRSQHGKVPWSALCIENTYTFYASVGVVILEIFGLLLFIFSDRGYKADTVYRKVQTGRRGYRFF